LLSKPCHLLYKTSPTTLLDTSTWLLLPCLMHTPLRHHTSLWQWVKYLESWLVARVPWGRVCTPIFLFLQWLIDSEMVLENVGLRVLENVGLRITLSSGYLLN
jgi:hypothetical protein